ncbi:MAG TPA: glycosyltransferase family 39 protein [Streptosporangiaceae bacterium]|nr:glycosyltransferase family 39 protein [Streptosporangiaceae bacterium]
MTITTAKPDSAGSARPAPRSPRERLLRARPGDPAWARPALLALLVAAALLYLVGLSRNGWANEFYAAAVQAGTKSWKAFLFGSIDSSNFITVDKTPLFLWPMELTARVFGLNSWTLLVPQALEGVATVGVLYTTVRRWFGPAAGIIAGAVMALTPVATLMFRFDNPDAMLVLLMTLAAYATTRAIESGRTRWVALAGTLIGLGYLAKMLQAFLVLPGLALAYLICGKPRLGKRAWQLLAGAGALLVASGWWVAIDLLTPAADRPYVGGSTDNSILNLTFSYNGLGRLEGQGGPGGGGGGGGFGGATGLARLFRADMGGQIAWLIPAALIALAVMLWVSRRAARTDRTRAAALLWGSWLLVTGLVFSFMSGIIHPYYTVALAPAVAALVGIGASGLWRIRRTWLARVALAAGIVATAAVAWVMLDRSPSWFPWLRVVVVVAAAGAAGLILAGPVARPATARGRLALAAVAGSLAVVAGLAGPLAYSLDTAATAHSGSIPSAGPTVASSFGGPGGGSFPGGGSLPDGGKLPSGGAFPGRTGGSGRPGGGGEPGSGSLPGRTGGEGRLGSGELPGGTGRSARGEAGFPSGGAGGPGTATGTNAALSKLLETGASGYKWAAATVSSTSAASLELNSTGVPVMAIGGFTGSDPAPSLAEFKKLVAEHEIHYFVGGGTGGGAGGPGGAGGSDSSQITSWVESHFTSKTVGGTTVYNLTSPKTSS